MPRTTVNIDASILEEIKAIQKKNRIPLGRIVTQLLAEALAGRKKGRKRPKLTWVTRPMRALVDLEDKDEVYAVLDGEDA